MNAILRIHQTHQSCGHSAAVRRREEAKSR